MLWHAPHPTPAKSQRLLSQSVHKPQFLMQKESRSRGLNWWCPLTNLTPYCQAKPVLNFHPEPLYHYYHQLTKAYLHHHHYHHHCHMARLYFSVKVHTLFQSSIHREETLSGVIWSYSSVDHHRDCRASQQSYVPWIALSADEHQQQQNVCMILWVEFVCSDYYEHYGQWLADSQYLMPSQPRKVRGQNTSHRLKKKKKDAQNIRSYFHDQVYNEWKSKQQWNDMQIQQIHCHHKSVF